MLRRQTNDVPCFQDKNALAAGKIAYAQFCCQEILVCGSSFVVCCLLLAIARCLWFDDCGQVAWLSGYLYIFIHQSKLPTANVPLRVLGGRGAKEWGNFWSGMGISLA